MNFKDYFSNHSIDYAQYRPRYPAELFAFLASVAPAHERAWDCATGNGQAALGLAPHFAEIIATDASESQLEQAKLHERIKYRLATAERTDLASGSVDLVTVAQALHWFDLDAFFAEARRVLRADGVAAVWCYNLLSVEPKVDVVVNRFYSETVGPYWSFERELVETGYRTIAFPFRELAAPEFYMQAEWNLTDLLGYLRTWSATQQYIKAIGADPIPDLGNELLPLWGDPSRARDVRWPLGLRVGRAEQALNRP